MSRYSAMFERCRARGEGAFGGFLMLGDPDPGSSLAYLDAIVAGGADMIEVGIPFSDPVADGPVIEAAAGRALAQGVRTRHCLDMIAEARARHRDLPIGVLTYANIVAARGLDRFCRELASAGGDSLLVADVPSLEAAPYRTSAAEAGIDLVMIAAVNTPPAALQRIAELGSGYTYCVARAGVTGAGSDVSLNGHRALFDRLSELNAAPPVLGFGISSPDHVRQAVAAGASGAISGSAIVDRIGRRAPPEEVRGFVATLKSGSRLPD